MVDKVERQNSDQHQQSAQLREQEKLHGRVDAPLVAPYDDQKIHRDQHQLPGEVEEKQVERQEYTRDSCENPHQVEVKEANSLADLRPGCKHGHDAEEEREQQHQEAEPIHRKMKVDAEPGDP